MNTETSTGRSPDASDDALPETSTSDVGSDVIVTHVVDANSPSWSRRRAVLTGVVIAAVFGAIFFGAYAATSAWICSARLDCGHWAPISIVAVVGFTCTTLAGGAFGYVAHRMYRLFKVT